MEDERVQIWFGDDDTTTGAKHPPHLRHDLAGLGAVDQDPLSPAAVEAGVGEGHLVHVRLDKATGILSTYRPATGGFQESLAVVEPDDAPRSPDQACQRTDVVPQPTADIKQMLPLVHL